MTYEFTETNTVDDLSFKTDVLIEPYELGLSIDCSLYSYYTESKKEYQHNEVVAVLPDDEAIKLRDYLNNKYPNEQNDE